MLPVDQVSLCQPVMVPSFLPAMLDLAVGGGAVAGDHQFGVALQEQLHGASAGLLGEPGGHLAPGVGAELAAEAAADVVHLDLDVGGGHLDVGRKLVGPGGDVLRGGPGIDVVALPLDHCAVRFQAAVGDDGDAVLAFGDHFGVLESLVGIADHLLAALLGAAGGLAEVVILDQVGQDFVFDLDFAGGLRAACSGGGGHGGDFPALPLDFGARGSGHVHGLHAGHLLGFAGVDAGDAGMGVRAVHVRPRTACPSA